MEFIKQIERLQLLNKLVKERRTGSPQELAERLGLSRRQLYSYIEKLNDQGLEIQFSRSLKSFVFAGNKEAQIEWKFKVLDLKEAQKLNGGKLLNSTFSSLFV